MIMKAILCKAFGTPDTLVVEEIDSPVITNGTVKIKVRACGVNFPDALMIQGLYQMKPPFPFSPGFEVSGDVIEIGVGVDTISVGDRVFANLNYGGFAEEVVVPEMMVMPMPSNMSYEHGAGFPLVYGTSHIALAHRGKLQAGETLLVLGAAGGVGLTAVELGKLMGAKVIAAASTREKLTLTQTYGADEIIQYSTENLRDRIKELTNGRGVDVMYDPVGGDMFDTAVRRVAWEGRYLVVGFASGRIPELPVNLPLLKNASIVGVFWGAYLKNDPATIQKSFHQLLTWYSEGKLKPHIHKTFPIDDAPSAIRELTERRAMGKVLLTM
jgi:NADPH:quinone reductase